MGGFGQNAHQLLMLHNISSYVVVMSQIKESKEEMDCEPTKKINSMGESGTLAKFEKKISRKHRFQIKCQRQRGGTG